jgi:hypothetical protein
LNPANFAMTNARDGEPTFGRQVFATLADTRASPDLIESGIPKSICF